MLDPIKHSEHTEKIVCKYVDGIQYKKYYRFRPNLFYGGISTADCVGCNLRCIFCWAWNTVNKPEKRGKFYSPSEVARKLVRIAKEKGFKKIRISGNEPTIGKEHLLSVLEKVYEKAPGLRFVLETNGILLGYDEDYVKELSKFDNLHIRVSLKACNPKEFKKYSNAENKYFGYQLKALKNLEKYQCNYHPALIMGENIENLNRELNKINTSLPFKLERESLILYPNVKNRLNNQKLF